MSARTCRYHAEVGHEASGEERVNSRRACADIHPQERGGRVEIISGFEQIFNPQDVVDSVWRIRGNERLGIGHAKEQQTDLPGTCAHGRCQLVCSFFPKADVFFTYNRTQSVRRQIQDQTKVALQQGPREGSAGEYTTSSFWRNALDRHLPRRTLEPLRSDSR